MAKVFDKGHSYQLDVYDGGSIQTLIFMKREGPGFPGNVGHHPGTNCQEVLRVLIDRVKYLDHQIPCVENKEILISLRHALILFEHRAARRHNRELDLTNVTSIIEALPACKICGHVECKEHT